MATATGSDFLQLHKGSAPARGLATWLTAALRAAIVQGRVAPGTRLPATRTLAGDLGISRGVVVEAYQRLGDEGLLSGRTKVGTVVMPLGTSAPAPLSPPRPPPSRPLSKRSPSPPIPSPSSPLSPPLAHARTGPSLRAERDRSKDVPRLPVPAVLLAPGELDLSPGVPDLAAFPRAAWLRAERAVLAHATAADLGYGDPRGSARLRQELASWLGRQRGIRADAGDLIIVAGVAQSLALLAQTLRTRGATAIAVEDPGSRGARDELAHWGLRPVPIPVDELGLQVDQLARSGLPAVLLTPAHQFPTGVVLAPERRRALLDWASTGALVIEDDYDAEHRYDRAPVPALHASAPGQVAHTGSTSKALAPGLRLGWLIPPADLYADLVAAKHASDLGSPAVPQLVLAHLIASGEYDRHLRLVHNRQRRRRDAMLAALRKHLPHARVEGVAAGLHLLITLPDLPGDLEDTDLADRILDAGIRVHPLSWHRHLPGPPGLVLGYAAHPPDLLHDAVQRIGLVLKTTAHESATARASR